MTDHGVIRKESVKRDLLDICRMYGVVVFS